MEVKKTKEQIKEELLKTTLFEDNDYLSLYCELIELNEKTPYDRLTSQSHHILPSFCFKILDLKVDDSKSNRVNLLYKDHILAHYYLSKCIIPTYYHNAFSAVLFLIRDKEHFNKFNIEELDGYQESYEKYKREYFQDEEINKKKSLSLTGLKRTEETKHLISKNSKGKPRHYSEESKLKHSNSLKGNKNRVGSKHSEESKLKISLNNKGQFKPETGLKLKNKPKSEIHKKNMSLSHMGKSFSEDTKLRMSLSQNQRDINTRYYKWVYSYDGKVFRGERLLLEYLKAKGFNLGATCLNNILKGNPNSKHYNELYGKIEREETKDFKHETNN